MDDNRDTGDIEHCWCGKQFFWLEPEARDKWWREHIHATAAEQQARDLMEACGVEDAQSFSSGDLVVLANFVADANHFRATLEKVRHIATGYTPSPDVVQEIAEVAAHALDNTFVRDR